MKEEIENIDKWFRLANYISVAQMYLKDNILLEEKLNETHLKKYAVGHWGVSPAVNFIYAHIINYAKRKKKNFQLIVGEGHAGCALLSNLFIQKEISKKYKEYTYDFEGLNSLIKNFGTPEGFRTEINPSFPNTIYDGGELGYSLPVAYGASLKNKNLFLPCIIGDGEAETGTISASWNLNKIISNNENGYVLPILNLNGYKMGSKSIFSTFPDEKLKMYFESMNYKVSIVHQSHEEMYEALESLGENQKTIIILKSKKGWTAVEDDEIKIEDDKNSHKNPLGRVNDLNLKIRYIEKWLKSYNINELISQKDFIDKDIIDMIPENNETKEHGNDELKKHQIINLQKYQINDSSYSNIYGIKNYLDDLIHKDKNFMIFSPDELESNMLGELLKKTSIKNNIVEILNENICQALLQGHINTGNRGVLISYEAFMPIITSMLSQYEKYIYQNSKISWRPSLNSITYILTSVCWENCYSHQNPEFLSNALGKNYDFVNVYLPMDTNSLIVALDKCINEKNKINIIDISKKAKKQYKNIEEATISIKQGIEIFSETSKNNIDVVLVAIGDYLLEEIIEASKKLYDMKINSRIVYISKLNILKELDNQALYKYFGKKEIIYVATHTYETIIKALMFNFKDRDIIINGYKDKSDISGNYKEKLEKNNLDSAKIVNQIIKKIEDNKYE